MAITAIATKIKPIEALTVPDPRVFDKNDDGDVNAQDVKVRVDARAQESVEVAKESKEDLQDASENQKPAEPSKESAVDIYA